MGTVPALLMLAAVLLVTFGALLGYAWRGTENTAIWEQANRRRNAATMPPVRVVAASVIDGELVDEYALEGGPR